ncbi:MAG TPA: M20/M25/M40 family metallo-hydrolase, partial [Solirubrobacter sp.]|nr:M20/M25/M40 family metallo-hydrolase [Solirubrobacter sp.]
IRNADDGAREAAIAALRAEVDAIGARRGVAVHWSLVGETPATPCSPRLISALEHAVEETGVPVRRLPSGAGHDAMTMASVTEVAMLFVRCAGGISHHPDEAVTEEDVALAIDAATRFVCSI